MAQHKSAEKRNRQNNQRKVRNFAVRSRMRKAVRAARAAMEANDPEKAALVKKALSEVSHAASKNVIPKNTASRYMSRLMRAAGR